MAKTNGTDREWRKGQRGGGGDGGVECATSDDEVAVRDGKDPEGSILTFELDSWRAFIAGIKAGEFDR